jgi:hypothetical protein
MSFNEPLRGLGRFWVYYPGFGFAPPWAQARLMACSRNLNRELDLPVDEQNPHACRTMHTSPALTIRISPLSVSTRNAPSDSRPRVVPTRVALLSITRIRLPSQ